MGRPLKQIRPEPPPALTEVPFIDLKRSFESHRNTILGEWEDVLAKAEFVGGKRVEQLEKKLAENLRARSVLACANGTDALILALQATRIGPGQKVALPNLTFWATYEAVVQVGATPVLVDIDEQTLQMDFDDLKSAHARFGLDAAILPHLYGWATPRLSDFRAWCREAGIALIEDGAQSYGVKVGGRSVYEDAGLSTISFYPAKVLGGAMDGGAIASNDPALLEVCRVLANHGRAAHYGHARVGWNSRMGGLQAAFLLEMADAAEAAIESRRRALDFYREYLSGEIEAGSVRFWMPPADTTGNGYLATLAVKGADPEEIQKRLRARGVGSARTYPNTIDEQPCVPREVLKASNLERSRKFTQCVLNLPMFAYITEDECRFAADALLAVIREGQRNADDEKL